MQEGWEPLCSFLGVPVPDVPFPRVNSQAEMRQHYARSVCHEWVFTLQVASFLLASFSPSVTRGCLLFQADRGTSRASELGRVWPLMYNIPCPRRTYRQPITARRKKWATQDTNNDLLHGLSKATFLATAREISRRQFFIKWLSLCPETHAYSYDTMR